MRELLDAIAEHAERLRHSRRGIAEFALRQRAHLHSRLEAAGRIESAALRDMTARALEAQAAALLDELGRLSAPAPGTESYAHG